MDNALGGTGAKLRACNYRAGLINPCNEPLHVQAALVRGKTPYKPSTVRETLLLVTGISTVVRATLLHRRALVAITGVGLLAILLAWVSGTRFVGNPSNGASLVTALATGVAILCYATILLAAGAPHEGE